VNVVVEFLHANRERLDLDRHGIGDRIPTVVLTPRFRASRHVVVLVLSERGDPVLVVKVPRLAFDTSGIASEFTILTALERNGGRPGVPRPVAFEEHHGVPLFVQTALRGRLLARPLARRRPVDWLESAAAWLATFPSTESSGEDAWDRLVERPLRAFAATVGEAWALDLVERTLDVVSPLRAATVLPLVLEHGDFGHPNVLVLPDGGLGAIDWELGEEHGLPAHDLAFFLMYLAIAGLRPETAAGRRAAFDRAFVAPDGWGLPALRSYCERVGVDAVLLPPLIVACFARYAARLVSRLAGGQEAHSELVRWLRDDRACDLWRHALDRMAGESTWL
jgi:aminoglycoside phosphotransferase (APT) family kinase protein